MITALRNISQICTDIKSCKSRSSWFELVHGENNLTSHKLDNDLQWQHWITVWECIHETSMVFSLWFQSVQGNINITLVNNFNCWLTNNHIHMHLATCVMMKSHYNLFTPLLWFLTFSLVSQSEREATNDERTHYGAVDYLNWNNRGVVAHQYSALWGKTGPLLSPLVDLTV